MPPRPTLARNLGFWLLAMLLGSGLLWVVAALTSPGYDSTASAPAYFTVLLAALAGVLSLAALPLLLPLLPWALAAASAKLRWLRIFTLQSVVMGLLVCLACSLGIGGYEQIMLSVATTYSVAGLLTAPLLYTRWLFPAALCCFPLHYIKPA